MWSSANYQNPRLLCHLDFSELLYETYLTLNPKTLSFLREILHFSLLGILVRTRLYVLGFEPNENILPRVFFTWKSLFSLPFPSCTPYSTLSTKAKPQNNFQCTKNPTFSSKPNFRFITFLQSTKQQQLQQYHYLINTIRTLTSKTNTRIINLYTTQTLNFKHHNIHALSSKLQTKASKQHNNRSCQNISNQPLTTF
jgi:hypothetical protein